MHVKVFLKTSVRNDLKRDSAFQLMHKFATVCKAINSMRYPKLPESTHSINPPLGILFQIPPRGNPQHKLS